MRDMGLVKIDEPFTRLFTQGMLLNHIYFRRNAKGGKEYHSPDVVTPTTDAAGHITGGRLADGSTSSTAAWARWARPSRTASSRRT